MKMKGVCSLPKHQLVFEQIVVNIFNGTFVPGTVLTEKPLADGANVSLASVRDALPRVRYLGLISRRRSHHASWEVATFTQADQNERLGILAQLLDLAYDCAFDRGDIPAIGQCLEMLSETAAGTGAEKLAAFHLHSAIWGAQKQSVLLEMMRQLCAPLFAFGSCVTKFEMHNALVEAMISQNRRDVESLVCEIFGNPSGVVFSKEPAA